MSKKELQDFKNQLKSILASNKNMLKEKDIVRLQKMGFTVRKSARHYKLYFNNKIYVLTVTPSDYRAVHNFISLVCRDIQTVGE